jgi:heme/copper-type cytochrome/quinol oxidase subunit 2
MKSITANESFWQMVIAAIIITAAVIVAVLLIIRKIRRSKKPDPCGGCSSDCDTCAFKQQVMKKP